MPRTRKSKAAPRARAPASTAETSKPEVGEIDDATAAIIAARADALLTELNELKAELEVRRAERRPKGRSDAANRRLDPSQENEVRLFIASRLEQLDQRKYQLSLVKDFVNDPSRFGIEALKIPTSTSLEEFAERRRELQYRISIVRTFLDLLTDELRLLEQAETYARETQEDANP